MTWNKGSAHLPMRMDQIRQIIDENTPHILALNEANYTDGDQDDIPGQIMINDNLQCTAKNNKSPSRQAAVSESPQELENRNSKKKAQKKETRKLKKM